LLQNGSLFAFLSFNIYFFHCKFTNSISLSVCRCKSKVAANILPKVQIFLFAAKTPQKIVCTKFLKIIFGFSFFIQFLNAIFAVVLVRSG
jgi:hypothetical protein